MAKSEKEKKVTKKPAGDDSSSKPKKASSKSAKEDDGDDEDLELDDEKPAKSSNYEIKTPVKKSKADKFEALFEEDED